MDAINTEVGGSMSGAGIMPLTVQPSGFLLGLSEDWRVECASANVGTFLGIEAGDLIGSAALAFLTDDAVHMLRNRLALLREPDGIERLFACQLGKDGRPFDVAIQFAGEQVVIEAEPSTAKLYGDVSGTLRGMMARVGTADGLSALCATAARQIRSLTGFDRVIITRLPGEGSPKVIADAARAPADRPAGVQVSAAALAGPDLAAVRRTLLHVVADIDAAPVSIVGDHCPDVACAVLRSASNDQLEQLRLLGARASVTIALEVDGALWGLVSCHHNAPRRISFERRAMIELFAQMFAMRIEIAELKAASSRGSALPT